MKDKYIIGIDAGSQNAKASIFNLRGQRICSASHALRPLHMPKPGIAEHPDDDLWDSIVHACRALMQEFVHPPETIIGIGLCTIRCCRVVLDEHGELAEPALNWMDARLAKAYAWNNPKARYLTTSSGYIGYRLTQKMRDTAANYEGQWPIDKRAWQWSDDAETLRRYKLSTDNLFELVMPGEVLGHVTTAAAKATGLPQGLPVVATANDKAVEALGAGLQPGSSALVSLGTYIGGMVVADQHTDNALSYFSNMACIPNRYLYECGGVRHGMATVSWLRDLLGDALLAEAAQRDISPEQLLNQEASCIPAGSDGLITLPEWLAPYDQPFKRGAMLGFHAGHTRAHLYKSMLEAIAMTMANHLNSMCLELNRELRAVVISGGGSNSDVFMQIFADVLGLPTQRTAITDAASLGAAMCVAVALQEHADFDQAMQAMVRPAEQFTPEPANTEFYQQLNRRVLQRVTCHTDPLMAELYTLIN